MPDTHLAHSEASAAAEPAATQVEEQSRRGPGERGTGGPHAAWFARFATATITPLLERVADKLRERGYGTSVQLSDASGRLIAALEVVPPGLPAGARPPRLSIMASRAPRQQSPTRDAPLLVEFTGTFPHAGATGNFGAEIDYTTIVPGQIEKRVAEFVEMATA